MLEHFFFQVGIIFSSIMSFYVTALEPLQKQEEHGVKVKKKYSAIFQIQIFIGLTRRKMRNIFSCLSGVNKVGAEYIKILPVESELSFAENYLTKQYKIQETSLALTRAFCVPHLTCRWIKKYLPIHLCRDTHLNDYFADGWIYFGKVIETTWGDFY